MRWIQSDKFKGFMFAATFAALFAFIVAAGFNIGHKAFAQSAGTYPASGAGTYGQPFGTKGAHWYAGGGQPPAINAACGTGAVIVGTDAAFILTTGLTASATCTATFAAPYALTPACNVAGESNLASFSVSPTGIIISGVLDSRVYHAQCVARAGGG